MDRFSLDRQALLKRRPSLANIHLPPQPEVLRKLMQEYRKSTPDLARMAALISGDMSLAAAVLQAVNSPLFSLTKSVVSIQQAIALLGLRWVLMLVRAVAFRDAWGNAGEHAPFWDTNNDVTALGLILARRLGTVDPEEVYALCLFHDGGMLILMRSFPDYKNTQHLCRAIMVHHRPFRELSDKKNALGPDVLTPLALLKTAHQLSSVRRRLWRAEENPEWLREGPEVMVYLGLERGDFLALQDSILEELERDDADG